jgi:protein O-mannosyl-transferase
MNLTPETPAVPVLPDSEPRWHSRLAVVILIAGTLLAMGRLCVNDFTWWDDQYTIHQNGWLQPPTARTLAHYWTTPELGLYIPLTYAAWAAIALFAHVPKDQYGIALNPWLFHGASLFCHVLAVLVAYRILRLVPFGCFPACCGAMLFAVHPLQVEAVAWASGLKDVLSGLLGLVAMWQYLLYARSEHARERKLRYLLACSAFILALLAKPSVLALPLAAAAIDRWVVGRSWQKVIAGVMGLAVIAVPFAVVARIVQDAHYVPMAPLWLRPLIALDAIAFYLQKLAWPTRLAVDYGRNPINVLAHGWCYWDWIMPAGLAAILVAGARARPILVAAAVVFVAGCLPLLGFTPAQFEFYSTTSDHYLYLSMLGPALGLAWLVSAFDSLSMRALFGLALLALAIACFGQGAYWQNDFTLFEHDTDVNPKSYMGYINLGEAHERAHDSADAIRSFVSATQANPESPLAWHDLAAALYGDGETKAATDAGQRSIELQIKYPYLRPSWSKDNRMIGQLLIDQRRFEDAIPYLRAATDSGAGDFETEKELREALKFRASQSMPATLPASSSGAR